MVPPSCSVIRVITPASWPAHTTHTDTAHTHTTQTQTHTHTHTHTRHTHTHTHTHTDTHRHTHTHTHTHHTHTHTHTHTQTQTDTAHHTHPHTHHTHTHTHNRHILFQKTTALWGRSCNRCWTCRQITKMFSSLCFDLTPKSKILFKHYFKYYRD